MTNRTWHKGPPPHVGWWNASAGRDKRSWRWWNGVNWSFCAYSNESLAEAVRTSNFILTDADGIEWTDYWPENARVPRVKPDAS